MQHFFADRSWVQGDKIRLEGSDVNHMKNVLRMKEGEEVQVSDGTGNAYLCQIEGYEGNQAVLKIREKTEKDTELPSKIWLFQGLPKGDKMELIVQKIFERAGEHPEVIPDLKKLMDYYLPMTVKLLDAYEDMDGQPVQGENITASKKEIEETIDTLNIAFEKLLDSIFRDTAWDVSTDISVLHTVLAQEGLTEDDFEKMKQNAEVK